MATSSTNCGATTQTPTPLNAMVLGRMPGTPLAVARVPLEPGSNRTPARPLGIATPVSPASMPMKLWRMTEFEFARLIPSMAFPEITLSWIVKPESVS